MIARLFSFCLALMLALPALAGCQDDTVHLRGDWGEARFTVEIADTEAARARGLMMREHLPTSTGMLFIYPRPIHAMFWMENTLISLDMLFVDATGVVRHVHHRARPLDRSPIDGGRDILMVLEINGGLADAMGIGAGTELRHARVPQSGAVWPC